MGVTCSSNSPGRLPLSPGLPGAKVSRSPVALGSSQTKDSARGAQSASTGGKLSFQQSIPPEDHSRDVLKVSLNSDQVSSSDDKLIEDADSSGNQREKSTGNETKEQTDRTALCLDNSPEERFASEVPPVVVNSPATSFDESDGGNKGQKDDPDFHVRPRQKAKFVLKEYRLVEIMTGGAPWDIKKFKEDFKVEVIRMEGRELEFDMINISAPLANAFRRVLMSEVPTMAIDEVCIYNNTSLIADEVLAHRLGLVPIKADPRLFENYNTGEEKTAQDSIEFHLKIKCTVNPNAGDSQDPNEISLNRKVYTSHLKWVPIGDQEVMYKEGDLRPVDNDILLAIMKPGQEIDLVAYCHKGIGKDHAKFSPVCTAHYRIMPTITLTRPITGEAAFRLQKLFSPGVIEIHDVDGAPTAMVAHPRRDRGSRNYLNDPEFKDCVIVERIPDHFIFCIESVGNLSPDVLMLEAVQVMIQKCDKFLRGLEQLQE